MAVKITVTLDCSHVLTFTDKIEDKYPFYCAECGQVPLGKYPWTLATEVVPSSAAEDRLAALDKAVDQIWKRLILDKVEQARGTLDGIRQSLGDGWADAAPTPPPEHRAARDAR